MALVEFQNNQAPYINAENLNNNFNQLLKGLKFTTIYTESNLGPGDTYNLNLPPKTLFVEPLLGSGGSNYSGGQFLTPGGAYTYMTSCDTDSAYRGIWMICNVTGQISISSYRHCGATVKGFRIWSFE